MIQTMIHHWATCLIALAFIVGLTFLIDRLGLIAWLAWLGTREKDRDKTNRSKENPGDIHRSEATKEYWRVHQ
jgi:hypothetical protein